MVGVRRVYLAALVGVVAFVALGASSCTGGTPAVGLGTAGLGDVTEVVDASATVTAKAVAGLTAPAAGSVAVLNVATGTSVRAGQVIAVIDSPAARQQLRQATAALAATRGVSGTAGVSGTGSLVAAQKRTDDAAATAFAQARHAATAVGDPAVRAALLAQIDAAAKQYDSVSATARSLVTSVRRGIASLSSAVGALGAAQRAQARSAYDLAKSTVDSLTLRAPIAGVVQLGGVSGAPTGGGSLADLLAGAGASTAAGSGARSGPGTDDAVSLGSQVSAGTPIATIVDTSTLGLVAEVDETDVILVAPGVAARVELDAAPGASYDSVVKTVDVLPTTSARGGVAYRVRLSLGTGRYSDGRAAPAPRPGMSAVAHLSVRQAHGVVTVPAAAVFTVDGHDAVWLDRDGHAVRTAVDVGVQGQDQVEIRSGVRAGDRIVVRGADRVRPGQSLP
jgi:HlyD family secretion protein